MQQLESGRIRWLLGACGFASMFSMRLCDAMLPQLSGDFLVGIGEVAATISGFALAYGVCQLVYGYLGDRLGKLKVMAWATMLCIVGSAAAALSPSLDMLIVSRVLNGAAAGGIIPLAMAWLGDEVGYEERQEALARLLTATVLGMIAGQWTGGLLAAHAGWRWAFLLSSALFLVSGAFLFRAAYAATSHGSANIQQGTWVQGLLAIGSKAWCRTILLTVALEGALVFGALAFIPTLLMQRLDLSAAAAGALAAVFGLGGIAYSRNARRLLGRFGERGLALLGGLMLAAGYGVLATSTHTAWSAIGVFCAGLGFYALHNTLQVNATQMFPQRRGLAVSLFASCLFLGQSIGIYAVSHLIATVSIPAVLIAFGLLLAVLGLSFARLVQRRIAGEVGSPR
ncbi:putative MFS family arabinose efflux permease [Comamonas sp. BIGb0124]|uniref:MFS transporter n=1 Tax=Comamonas sp. BIGb0124 TaxID=2485130 RepID=UPI000FAD5173|nr:MFS transporter [Comamonas sp. BIGb0124]ROR24396.1 putative MFS family arabinose efflux permease [Comamonas sp. BIGb0124]